MQSSRISTHYRFIPDQTRMYLISNKPVRIGRQNGDVRFLTVPLEQTKKGAAVWGTIWQHEAEFAAKQLVNDGALISETDVNTARCICDELSLPLIVSLGSICNLQDREEVRECYFAQPHEPLTTHWLLRRRPRK
jgi:hypothetical protein